MKTKPSSERSRPCSAGEKIAAMREEVLRLLPLEAECALFRDDIRVPHEWLAFLICGEVPSWVPPEKAEQFVAQRGPMLETCAPVLSPFDCNMRLSIWPSDLVRLCGRAMLAHPRVVSAIQYLISGHRTRAGFDRYNIVSGEDLRDAATKRSGYEAHLPQKREEPGTKPVYAPRQG
jgi:hypothetical protein